MQVSHEKLTLPGQQSNLVDTNGPARAFRPSANYESPLTERESWWRCELKETPIPGKYNQRGWLEDLEKKKFNSSFRSSGRTRPAHSWLPLKGSDLMPGAYAYDDFFMNVLKKPQLSSMRSPPRKPMIIEDKEIKAEPGSYKTETYESIYAEKMPSHHMVFRSTEPRSSRAFEPKLGPPPGGYDVPKSPPKNVIRSSFLNTVPRFARRASLTPGPGAYGPMDLTPNSRILKENLGKNTGLFFTPGTTMA